MPGAKAVAEDIATLHRHRQRPRIINSEAQTGEFGKLGQMDFFLRASTLSVSLHNLLLGLTFDGVRPDH